MLRLTSCLALFLILIGGGVAFTDTIVGGFISADTQWPLADSPYHVTSNIAVVADATLTIDPGVEIRFDPGLSLTVGVGTLVARGAEASPIRFTAQQTSPTVQPWGHIEFSDDATDATFGGAEDYVSGSILEYVTVEFAGSGGVGAVRAVDSSPFIHASNVQHSVGGGIYVNGQGADLIRIAENTVAHNRNGSGIKIESTRGARIEANTIEDNITTSNGDGGVGWGRGGGVRLWSAPTTSLSNNTITSNTAGLYGGGIYLSDSDSCDLSGNTITNNSAAFDAGGIASRNSSNVTLLGDRITGNNFAGIELGGGSDGWVLGGNSNPGEGLVGPFVQIYGNDTYQIYNVNVFSGFGYDDPGNIDARYVDWGTVDELEIVEGIYDVLDNSSYGAVFYQPYAVPEPSTLILLTMGAVGLLAFGWRRRR